MQIDSYLASLMHYSGIDQSLCSVVYKGSDQISYDSVAAAYSDVNWIDEKDFYSDFRSCVEKSSDYVLLGCDDVLFKDFFDPNTALHCLADDENLFAFSLRLGANLHSLPDLEIRDDLLRHDWRKAGSGNWGYPWDVSGSIYRRQTILDLLDRYQGLTNPNRLEGYIAEKIAVDPMVPQSWLSSFAASKCVTLTINRVQDEFANDFDDSQMSNPDQLYAAYQDGKRLNWARFSAKQYSRIHIDGNDFELIDGQPVVDIRGYQSTGKAAADLVSRGLPLKIAFWGLANKFKERIRPVVPRSLYALLRRLI